VAVLVPSLTNALFVDLLEAAQRVLRGAGFQTLIGITHYDAAEEEQLVREQLLHRPAGVLLTGLGDARTTRQQLAAQQTPCVCMMELPAHGTEAALPWPSAAPGGEPGAAQPGARAEPGLYSVGFSQVDAAAAMTRHLLARGRQRIAFAAAQLDPRTLQRLQGWRQELGRSGGHDPRLEWLDPAPSSVGLGAQMFEQIRAAQPEVDAIFFCNDDLAHGALLAALRMGVQVPRQIAIAGFNDLPESAHMVPPLTTVRTPRAEVGEQAAKLLLSLIRKEPPPASTLDLGFELVQRAST
jgi:LacI family gluconate utilization system Gnt-I transcriptional repressor